MKMKTCQLILPLTMIGLKAFFTIGVSSSSIVDAGEELFKVIMEYWFYQIL